LFERRRLFFSGLVARGVGGGGFEGATTTTTAPRPASILFLKISHIEDDA
jgi:hypothetical protein